jgi:hypothetical protein
MPIEVEDDSPPLVSPPTPSVASPILVPNSTSSVPLLGSNKRKAHYELRDDVSSTSTEDETSEHQDSSPPPLQKLIKKNEVISIIEEEEDPTKFRFHYVKNGTKKLKEKKQHIADRLHYKCNQHDKKDMQCTAMYKVTVPLSNPSDKRIFFLKEQDHIHNHHPPTSPKKRGRMDKEQKERVADYFKMGVKPARIHQKLVTEDSEKAPSMS